MRTERTPKRPEPPSQSTESDISPVKTARLDLNSNEQDNSEDITKSSQTSSDDNLTDTDDGEFDLDKEHISDARGKYTTETRRETDLKPEQSTPLKSNLPGFQTPFVFGSAAKSLVTFNTIARSDSKADFSSATREEFEANDDTGNVFNSKKEGKGGLRTSDTKVATKTSTGEENETTKFHVRVKLFEFDVDTSEWKERGVGMIKVNEHKESRNARIIMRADGVLRLLLNVRLFPGISYEIVQNRNVRFAAISQPNGKTATYLLRFKTIDDVASFVDQLLFYCAKEKDDKE